MERIEIESSLFWLF